MRKTIWKYKLGQPKDVTEVSMPVGADILHVGMQDDEPCLWVLVDQDMASVSTRKIACFGTGNPCNEAHPFNYLGTIVGHRDVFVWHYFELV